MPLSKVNWLAPGANENAPESLAAGVRPNDGKDELTFSFKAAPPAKMTSDAKATDQSTLHHTHRMNANVQ
jgi:hypothetical protein